MAVKLLSAERLQTLCLDVIACNLNSSVSQYIPAQDLLVLREGLYLPAEVADGE